MITFTIFGCTERPYNYDEVSQEERESVSIVGFYKCVGHKIIPPAEVRALYKYELSKDLSSTSLLSFLGGREKATVNFNYACVLMAKQPNGEEGELLTNGRSNIFFVSQGHDFPLYILRVAWYGGGWKESIWILSNPDKWTKGDQVFSHNPILH